MSFFYHSRWLEKCICIETQKRNVATNDFEKNFEKLLKNAFFGKTMENVSSRLGIKFDKRDDEDEKTIKQQSQLTFNGIQKSYTNCSSFTFRQKEVLKEKLFYLGFAV